MQVSVSLVPGPLLDLLPSYLWRRPSLCLLRSGNKFPFLQGAVRVLPLLFRHWQQSSTNMPVVADRPIPFVDYFSDNNGSSACCQ